MPRDGAKADILPVLIAAESAGRFAQPPKRPEYLVKAMVSSDETKMGRGVDWMSYAKQPAAAAEIAALDDIAELRRLAKDHGVNSFGKDKDFLRTAITDKLRAA